MIKLKSLISERVKEIPRILYHATFYLLAQDIKDDGIIPRGVDIQNFSGIPKGVYLSSDPEYAASMVEVSENPNIPEEWFGQIVIIAIDSSKLDISKLYTDPNVAPQEDEYDSDTPPDDTVYSYIYKGIIHKNAILSIDNHQ